MADVSPGGPNPGAVETLADLVRAVDLLRARAAIGTRKARVSLNDLAARVDMPRSTVHAHISGVTLPPADVLDRIVIALGATPQEQALWADAWFRVAAHAQSGRRSTTAPRQLPPDVRGFVGRDHELAELDGLLADGGVSVIAGTAGVGKTALALHWAHRVADRFPDGQLYLNLRGYDEGAPVRPADALGIALGSLGLPDADVRPTLDERVNQYRTLLAGRRVLIVLDNANCADQVRDLFPGTPACFVLVTSRDALPGLVARDGARRIDLDLLPESEAIALLRQLIGERVDTERDAALALVRQCARLPLALRIAAERARGSLPLARLVDELSDERRRLDALDAGGDPQTAVRAVFSWSYRNLTDQAARLFRLLGRHPGRQFDFYAASALLGTDGARPLDELMRAHLVEHAGDRFRMHDLLRMYAAELAEPDWDTAVTGLLDYYRAAAAEAMNAVYPSQRHRRPEVPPSAVTPPSSIGRDWLDAENDNLVAIARFAAQQGFPEHVAQLAATLWRHLDTTARWADALAVCDAALTSARSEGDQATEATALSNLGTVLEHHGRHDDAIAHFERALEIRAALGDRAGMAAALNAIGIAQDETGRFAEASASHQRALELRREAGDRLGEAMTLLNLGIVRESRGDYAEAGAAQRQALALFRELGDRLGEGHALNNLGNVLRRSGDSTAATDHHTQALTIYRELGSVEGEAFALAGLGAALHRRGHLAESIELLEQALTVADEIGLPGLRGEVLNNLGETLLDLGRADDARAAHEAAHAVAFEHDDRYEQARACHGTGRALLVAEQHDDASEHLQLALKLYEVLGVPDADRLRADIAALEPTRGNS